MLETWILVLLPIVNVGGIMEFGDPKIVAFHDTQKECYEHLGEYITLHAQEAIDDPFVLRCLPDHYPGAEDDEEEFTDTNSTVI